MKYAQTIDDRQDELIGELNMITGWGDNFSIRRHAMGVRVEAERIPAEAIALTDRIHCLVVVDIKHHYADGMSDEPTEPVAKITYGWS